MYLIPFFTSFEKNNTNNIIASATNGMIFELPFKLYSRNSTIHNVVN